MLFARRPNSLCDHCLLVSFVIHFVSLFIAKSNRVAQESPVAELTSRYLSRSNCEQLEEGKEASGATFEILFISLKEILSVKCFSSCSVGLLESVPNDDYSIGCMCAKAYCLSSVVAYEERKKQSRRCLTCKKKKQGITRKTEPLSLVIVIVVVIATSQVTRTWLWLHIQRQIH